MAGLSETTPRILLIDDDEELCHLMSDFFAPHGFLLDAAHDGLAGLQRMQAGGVDLILLDVMMPRMDGFEMLRQLRRNSDVPVIMLTARTSRDDRIRGLNGGADDYLPKPFGPEELLARIHAVLRRSKRQGSHNEVVELGRLCVDTARRLATFQGRPLDLTSIEFDILDVLSRAAGRTVTRDELSAQLYQRPATPFERAIDVHISHLRKKLETAPDVTIRTVRGAGYHMALAQETVG